MVKNIKEKIALYSTVKNNFEKKKPKKQQKEKKPPSLPPSLPPL